MDIGNQHNFSTIPLTTVSPRPVNTNIASTSRSALSADDEDPQQKQAEQKRAEQKENQQNNRVLQQLRARDREVRAHEAAHAAVGGQYVTGGPSFTLQRGPDGRSYAIGGEVSIDTSAIANDPEATLAKAEIVRRAALAPAQPSPQDLRVAARVTQTAAQARVEIAVIKAEEAEQALQERRDTLEQAQLDDEDNIDSTASLDVSTNETTAAESNSTISSNVFTLQSFESSETRESSFSLFA